MLSALWPDAYVAVKNGQLNEQSASIHFHLSADTCYEPRLSTMALALACPGITRRQLQRMAIWHFREETFTFSARQAMLDALLGTDAGLDIIRHIILFLELALSGALRRSGQLG